MFIIWNIGDFELYMLNNIFDDLDLDIKIM